MLQLLLKDRSSTQITGLDVSHRALEVAAERLRLDRMRPGQRQRNELLHGALTCRDARLSGYDAAVLMEVIEHLDVARLAAMERMLFEFAQPALIVCPTPNVEYHGEFAHLPAGQLRHKDHRFEWTRAEFSVWAQRVTERHGDQLRLLSIESQDPIVGAPSQMGVFSR